MERKRFESIRISHLLRLMWLDGTKAVREYKKRIPGPVPFVIVYTKLLLLKLKWAGCVLCDQGSLWHAIELSIFNSSFHRLKNITVECKVLDCNFHYQLLYYMYHIILYGFFPVSPTQDFFSPKFSACKLSSVYLSVCLSLSSSPPPLPSHFVLVNVRRSISRLLPYRLSRCVCLRLSLSLPLFLFIYVSAALSLCLCLFFFISLSQCLCASLSLSVCVCVCVCLSLSLTLSRIAFLD